MNHEDIKHLRINQFIDPHLYPNIHTLEIDEICHYEDIFPKEICPNLKRIKVNNDQVMITQFELLLVHFDAEYIDTRDFQYRNDHIYIKPHLDKKNTELLISYYTGCIDLDSIHFHVKETDLDSLLNQIDAAYCHDITVPQKADQFTISTSKLASIMTRIKMYKNGEDIPFEKFI